MKKILITGANSYVGTSFEKYLIKWSTQYQLEVIDMIDGSWREKSFTGYDTIFHVAGIAHSDSGIISEEKKNLYYQVNTKLPIEVAQKAKKDGVKQFIFMSSIIVYGESAPVGKTKIINIDTPVSPSNAYGDSKLQAEKGISPLQSNDFNIVILRPPMIYGKGCKGNYSTLSKYAQRFHFFPYVSNQRSMIYIDNLCEFVRLMIENDERGTFYPQNEEYCNTSQLVKMIANTHNKKINLIHGFSWAMKIISPFTKLINKAFGNLVYDLNMSNYKEKYCKIDLNKSIIFTESED